MKTPDIRLIDALRTTAKKLKEGAFYAWGHHGACNCGNLIQTLTHTTKEEVQKIAFQGNGEWSDLACSFGEWSNENQTEYCENTGINLDTIFSQLSSLGLTQEDIHNIEYLEDREVLRKLPGGMRYLNRNDRNDVILYFETYANVLEEKLLSTIELNINELLMEKAESSPC